MTAEMTGEDFTAWMEQQLYNVSTAARDLGISRMSVMKYKEEGAPQYIGLACAALALGIPPFQKRGWKWREAIKGKLPHQ